ncbi:MAG: hypothetical protein K2Q28_14685 [Hyphomicrobium sp.]|nr:hypothetical protein [Hyphomicrobium sp.]
MKPGPIPGAAALMGLFVLTAPAEATPFDALARSIQSQKKDLSAVTEVNARQRKYSRWAWRDRRYRLHRRHLYRPYYLDSPYYYSTAFDGYPYVSRRGYPFRSWDRGAILFRQW